MNSSPETESLRYPIGRYRQPEKASADQIKSWIEDIESFPGRIEKLTSSLSEDALNRPYRPGGWSVRQVVHHCADSHMNAFFRFKLTLTEDMPTIKPYFEDRWAELPDTTTAPVSASLILLKGLHTRWTVLLRSMNETDLDREFFHPEHNKQIVLWRMLGLYAWHCNHHLAHIKLALKQE